MRILHIYRKDARNAGDLKSSPHLYFKFKAEQATIDVMELEKIPNWCTYDAVIVGGGGLLQDDWFMPALAHLRENFHGRIIVWGIGFNNQFSQKTIHFAPSWARLVRLYCGWLLHGRAFCVEVPTKRQESTVRRDDWLKRGDLVGIRDYNKGFDWVPCASCMDESIDRHRDTAPKHKLVIVDHPDACRIELRGVPRISNLNSDFADILAFIASGETLLSSSYHAAYWGLLLGRRVVVVPWSEKFYGFKHPIPACSRRGELSDCIARSRSYPEALSECRDRNLEFIGKAADLLKLSWGRI